MGRTFNTTVGRASFPHLSTPNTFGKYGIVVLMPKDDVKAQEKVSEIWAAMSDEAIAQAGKEGAQAVLAGCQALRDGDDKSKFKTWRAEYAGNFVISASRKADFGKPCVVNRNKQPIDASEVYAGCNVIVHIDVYGCAYAGKKFVNLGFQHVMKVSDNTPFAGGGVTAEDAFSGIDLPEEVAPVGFNTAPMANPLATQVQSVVSNAQQAIPSGPIPVATPPAAGATPQPFNNPFGQV